MNKIRAAFILLFLMAAMIVVPTAALADTGPKPSVVVYFEGLRQTNCYVTLLASVDSTGPYWVYDGNPERALNQNTRDGRDPAIWSKFVQYKDTDGFYFLQYYARLDSQSTFTWGYYPPQKFKILMYFPDDDTFMVSNQVYERYAFDSYFKVDASKINPAKSGTISAVKSYNYSWEIISLIARIIITIFIETMIALLFSYRAKKQLAVIVATNLLTQTLLNVLLNIINYNQGKMRFVFNYVWMELLVFVIEAAVYYLALNKYSTRPVTRKWVAVVYALAANAASFGAGLVLAHFVPDIF